MSSSKDRPCDGGCGAFVARRSKMCRECYGRSARGVRPDTLYRKWITSKRDPSVSADIVRPWAEELLAIFGGRMLPAAESIRLDASLIGMILAGTRENVSLTTAELIAEGVGKSIAAHIPPAGRDDWSSVGRYCGDGAVVGEGCGSFFHDHHAGGLCEECYGREVLGVGPDLPRDVRVTAEAIEAGKVFAYVAAS